MLVLLAGGSAVAFRRLPPPIDLRAMTWDAACHALIGLDILDHLRRFELLRLLVRLEDQRWWPPLFGFVSLPAWVIGGRQVSSPSLVSLASYALIPAVAWVTLRRVTTGMAIFGWGLVAVFFLRSPALIEMSTWSMLEPVAALFALGAFCCFFAGPASRARNWAYGFAGASTLLKYHYGFFLLVTLTAATLAELPRDELRHVFESIRRNTVILIGIAVLAVALAAKRATKLPLPSTSNLIWITYVIALATIGVRWVLTKRAPWKALPEPLPRLVAFGLSWPLIWFIDPANIRAWVRELGVTTDPAARWIDQVRIIGYFLVRDYSFGAVVLAAILIGVALALVEGFRRRHVGIVALTLHAIWPAALMSASSYLIETRFLATLAVCLYASAAIGWILFLERRELVARTVIATAFLALLIVDQALRMPGWTQQLRNRRVYGYASDEVADAFVRSTVHAFNAGVPLVIVLPPDLKVVAPTIRLGLRLPMPDVGPDDVEVDGGDIDLLRKQLRRFRGGLAGAVTDRATMARVAEEDGLRIVGYAPGPAVPGDARRQLLIARVVRP